MITIIVTISCDHIDLEGFCCQVYEDGFSSEDAAQQWADSHGWTTTLEGNYCPEHKPESA